MKSYVNRKLVKRNSRIGQYTWIAALVVQGVGLLINFKYPDQIAYSLGALLIGFFLSQVGIYYGNRWGRNPRPDEVLDRSLKGLGREFTVYHYATPVPHLLVGPAGVWALLPYYQSGTVTYEKNRWRARGGGFVQSYLRIFGQENLGRPDLDAGAEIAAAKRFLSRSLPEGVEPPEVRAALIFVHPKVELNTGDAPVVSMKAPDLKEFLKGKAKEKPITPGLLQQIQGLLPEPEKDE